ncbi:MAG: DUF421 domain-containing protein [Oscillospiraceae bacterium]
MEVLTIVLTTLLSLVAMFLLTKLMGHKQVYQMTMFDYVVGITIGSIAAELATELEKPWQPLLAMVLYAVVAFLISVVTNHSRTVRKQISGTPVVLLDNGKLYRESFRKAKMDLDDFLCACRTEGYFDLSQIQTALLEHNGRVSILPTVGTRPATPADLHVQPPQEFLMTPVIMDGEIQWDALTHLGVDETWLRRSLERKRGGKPEEVFLALCDRDRELTVYPMT